MKIGFDSVFLNWFSQGIITHRHVSTKLGQFNVCVPGDEIILTSNTLVSSGTQVTHTPVSPVVLFKLFLRHLLLNLI